jgi:hypothetical protein
MEPLSTGRRARRYGVSWSARVRRVDANGWQRARTLNLSVTGVLLHTHKRYRVGERVEVEIDFLTHADLRTVIAGVGNVIREDHSTPRGTAIQFINECELTRTSRIKA